MIFFRHFEKSFHVLIVVFVFIITEPASKLQGVEARCKVLEKQLDYMRKMVENAKKERNALVENQVVQNAITLKKQNDSNEN